MEFPITKPNIKLAMLGMTEGNGHPYSWSIIFNGRYDAEALQNCPYPAITDYIAKQPINTLGIKGAEVTHIWTDDPADAIDVAKVAKISTVVDNAVDVIGQVDAVLIATDKGEEHVERCRPFIEAGIPVFIDKPLCNNRADLKQFSEWAAEGKLFISSSAMRFAKEFEPYHRATHELGALRYINFTMAKSWETYGIHSLEAIYPIVGPGFISVQNTGEKDRNILHLKHRGAIDINIVNIYDLAGGAGMMTLAGTHGGKQLKMTDSYYAFKTQLQSYVDYLRTGVPPVPWQETKELMQLVIAGIESRERDGATIYLKDLE
ncbi:MAG: Gfo/Idh/MocA family oxidoreductase [Rhizobiales bacterium]|nr:Gfo/Idh/MocA family oxidoreductase [Hyphomicrobiales bacterium]NRB14307.1 Gfo/Idh/MocA family oxidoreductase [Hyphomicrobiales bacterium]